MTVHRIGLMILSFLIAAVLTIVPLPSWIEWYRPAWMPLCLIYWVMASEGHFSLGLAWCIGLFQDALLNTYLGQFALAFTLLAYLTLKFRRRMRLFPIGQQGLCVLLLLLCYQLLVLWMRVLLSQPSVDWHYWLPLVTSVLMWPVVMAVLNTRQRKTYAGK